MITVSHAEATRAHRRERWIGAACVVVLGCGVGVYAAVRDPHRSTNMWQRLPDPALQVAEPGATIGASGGDGPSSVALPQPLPAGPFEVLVTCRGAGTMSFVIARHSIGGGDCARDSDRQFGVNVQGGLGGATTLRVHAPAGVSWRVAVTAS